MNDQTREVDPETSDPVVGPSSWAGSHHWGWIGSLCDGESRKWPVGLGRQPMEAKAFYAMIVLATMVGVIMNFTPLNPIKALYWSAVINGVVSVPVMALMMLMAAQTVVMGAFAITGWIRFFGWAATIMMALAVLAMVITSLA